MVCAKYAHTAYDDSECPPDAPTHSIFSEEAFPEFRLAFPKPLELPWAHGFGSRAIGHWRDVPGEHGGAKFEKLD